MVASYINYLRCFFLLMQIYECYSHIRQLNESEDDHDKATTVTLVENYQLIANQYYAKKIEVYSFMIEKAKFQSKIHKIYQNFHQLINGQPQHEYSHYKNPLFQALQLLSILSKTAKVRHIPTDCLLSCQA